MLPVSLGGWVLRTWGAGDLCAAPNRKGTPRGSVSSLSAPFPAEAQEHGFLGKVGVLTLCNLAGAVLSAPPDPDPVVELVGCPTAQTTGHQQGPGDPRPSLLSPAGLLEPR